MMMMMMIDRPLSIITSYTLGPGYRPVVCRRNYFSNGSIRRIFFVDGALILFFCVFFFVSLPAGHGAAGGPTGR